jgi:hypothetical protein
MGIDVLVIVGVGLAAGLLNVTLGAFLQRVPVQQFVRTFTRLDVIGLTFAGLGASSLALSYTGALWVHGARASWWESFHLEIGASFVILGAIETLLFTRADRDDDRR